MESEIPLSGDQDSIASLGARVSEEVSAEYSCSSDDGAQRDPNRSRDVFVYGLTALLACTGVIKDVVEDSKCEIAPGIAVPSAASDLELCLVTCLGYYRLSKVNDLSRFSRSIVGMWAMVLAAAGSAASAFEALAGLANPDPGTAFSTGADRFEPAQAALRFADPDPSQWSGAAADLYAARNASQENSVAQMVTWDREMTQLVGKQADQAMTVRAGIVGTKTTLATGALVCGVFAYTAAADMSGAADQILGKLVSVVGGATFLTLAGLAVTAFEQSSQNAGVARERARWTYDTVSGAPRDAGDTSTEYADAGKPDHRYIVGVRNLDVDPRYLQDLADLQRTAATHIGEATAATDDISKLLWLTHGVLFGTFGVPGIQDNAQSRRGAGAALQNRSEELAELLDKANTVYENADQEQGRNLSTQQPSSWGLVRPSRNAGTARGNAPRSGR